MKLTWILFAAALPAFAQQTFDFKSLDKIGANAKESTNITLEGDALKLATSFFGDALRNLTGVYVRNFEFAKTGQYKEEDLAPVRAYIKSLNWTKVVDVKESEETSEIYVHALPENKLGGLAIVALEPTEVTVVFISGVLNAGDLAKLTNLGIPDIKLDHGTADPPKKD